MAHVYRFTTALSHLPEVFVGGFGLCWTVSACPGPLRLPPSWLFKQTFGGEPEKEKGIQKGLLHFSCCCWQEHKDWLLWWRGHVDWKRPCALPNELLTSSKWLPKTYSHKHIWTSKHDGNVISGLCHFDRVLALDCLLVVLLV